MPQSNDPRHTPAAFQAGRSYSWHDLRRRAEARLGATEILEPIASLAVGAGSLTPNTHELLVHELQVHQLELEMQNDELRQIQEELEISRARYFDLFDLAPMGYLTLDEAGLVEEANLAAATLLGIPRAELVGRPLTRFILPEDQDAYYSCRNRLWSTGERQVGELRLRCDDGQSVWIRLETSLSRDARSAHTIWRATLSDITERKRSERDLLDTLRLRLMGEIAELTFWEWSPNTDEVHFPPEWHGQTGYDPAEAPKRLGEWAALLHPEDGEPILFQLTGFVDAPETPCEIQYRLRRKDGLYRWFVARLKAIQDARGQVERVLLVQQDVTARKQAEDRAIEVAQHDPLTGLPGRALLEHVANHMLASARRAGRQLAVLFFDLDRFKAINDAYGHPVGDRLLRAVAQRLLDTFRAEDLVARLGGDEFVVVLSHIRDADDAARAARNAIVALTPAYAIEGLELPCVASLGISLFPQDGDNIDCLIQRADLAMYHAKQFSPGHYQFVTEALNRKVCDETRLEARLREGLSGNEFRLVYQPVLDTRSGAVTGVEALLRWPQPDRSDVAPQNFLPVAEFSGLIHELGRWVFQEACRQHLAWRNSGLPPIRIAVNVSARQFHHQGFLGQLTAASEAAGIDPGALSLELSGAALMQDKEGSQRLLGELKQLRVGVALDDFGMGCSAIGELEQLPLERLEINRALVQRLGSTDSMPAVLKTIIGFGHALKLDITAVGVEAESDLEFFRAHRCNQVQGFFLGVPMSGERFVGWYREHAARMH
ncbi:PAS domain S-box/diguanylate cyclase (GGDEF) domain-containing protein [Thiocystis violascens DSM 198]|uniref:PAS domain S-box/diguanylate cyclase (GGDEF) domain-containing protein n=2 Tax=Thiocystis violascens TaxID=73141 RepID=I3YBZ0_THIV6|nr:PAS domain S-box/diguanylate cyclase (GGDEF) domain-containing protein [Thiocystis violascens DSM 198]